MLNLQTQIIEEPADAERELAALGLTVEMVTRVARQSRSAKMETLPIDPCNSPGTQSYIYGVRAIRKAQLRKKGWRMCRDGNLEATVNDKLGIQLLFQNVDCACGVGRDPESMSEKGGGARRLVQSGNQRELFGGVQPAKFGKIGTTPKVWLICVSSDEKTLKAEVSAPMDFEGNQYSGFSKRIFVVNERFDPEVTPINNDDTGGPDVEVLVKRK
ncbi:hypothetical protein [Variovorax sp. RCC_210]|uniref:hypothetical protein n=1 Tax=Variovorax sp. RCC_210 TaxID=3239217 RepID=UPI0035266DD0